jgi:hypothetical protein
MARDERPSQQRSALDRQAHLLHELPRERDLTNSAEAQPPDHSMSRRLGASDVHSGEKVVNPLSLYISDKASNINVIRWQS